MLPTPFFRAMHVVGARFFSSNVPVSVRDCRTLADLSRVYSVLMKEGERAGVPSPSTAGVFVEVLERAVALRGGPVLPWDLQSSPSPLALSTSTSDAPYLDSLRGTLVEATGKASFRLDPREYERVLSALRDLGEDDTALHNGLARGFVWDATLEKPPRQQQPFQRFHQQEQAQVQQQQQRRRKEERELALRVYAEALSSGVIVSRVVAAERFAGGWKGGDTTTPLSSPLSDGDLERDANLARTLSVLSTQARERVCTFMGDQCNAPTSFPPPSILLSTSYLFSAPPPSSQPSTSQGSLLPIWLRTLFAQRAASRLFILANRSINHKLGAKASKSPASLGRAAIKVALMTPLAEAAVCCTSALFRQCAVEVGAMEGQEGGVRGDTQPKPLLLRRWGSQQPSSFPQSHPLILATSAIIQTLTKCVSTALPVDQIHDFWAAKATEKSAGGEASAIPGKGIFPASSYSLFYGIGAPHAYSSSSSSSSSASSASSSSASSSSEGSEDFNPLGTPTQSNYRTHEPVHALGAHVHDWAPPVLTAIALWLECGLAATPYSSFVSLNGVVGLQQQQREGGVSAGGVEEEREGGKVAWIGGIRRETRQSLVDALEAIKMCTRAINLHYTGVLRSQKHLRYSWGSWCKITQGRAAADAAAAAAAAATSSSDESEGGERNGDGLGRSGGGGGGGGGDEITVTHDSASLDMYAVGAVRDPSSGGGGGGGGGVVGDGGGLHPKYACTIAATSLAPAILRLLVLLHPLVVSVEGMVGGGGGLDGKSDASNEILGAIEEVLGVCSWASRTLSPVHPLLYYTACYDSGGAGRHLGATHNPHLAAQWLRGVASGVRILGWGVKGGDVKGGSTPKAAAIMRNLKWEAVRVVSAGLVSPGSGSGSGGVGGGVGVSSTRPFWWPVSPLSRAGGIEQEVLDSFQLLGINPDTLYLPRGSGGTGESSSSSSGVISPPSLSWGALPRSSITSPPWAIALATLVREQEEMGCTTIPLPSSWGPTVTLRERLAN